MNVIIFGLTVTIAASPALDKSSDEQWRKLNQYQEITGLSDEIIMAIWIKSIRTEADAKQGILKSMSTVYF